MNKTPEQIIFYDGDCGFCNSSVQFVLKHEKNKKIHFSALQSGFSKDFFEKKKLPIPDFSTFYFFDNGKLYAKSTAGLRVSGNLKFPYSLLKLFVIVPSFIRDKVYDFIAKKRQKIFKGFCMIPSVEDKIRFL